MKLLFSLITLLSINAHAGPTDRAYFEQFLYKEEDISTDPDFPQIQYRYMSGQSDVKTQIADGRYVALWVDVALYQDGTYEMQYREMYFQKPTDTSFIPGRCHSILGKWDVPNTQLEIDNYFVGDPLLYSGQNAVQITMKKEIVSPEMVGKTVRMLLAYSNVSLKQMMCF
jgi:hypothetical protein